MEALVVVSMAEEVVVMVMEAGIKGEEVVDLESALIVVWRIITSNIVGIFMVTLSLYYSQGCITGSFT